MSLIFTQFCCGIILFVYTILGGGALIELMHAGTLDIQPRV